MQLEAGAHDEHDEGEGDPPGLLADHRDRVLQGCDDEEVLHGPPGGPEVAARQEDERVTGVELDVAELAGDLGAGAVDGDHGGPVAGAAADLLQCAADQVRLPPDDRLEVERLAGVAEHVGLFGRGAEAGAGPQVEHVGDVADEDQQVVGLQQLVGADRAEVPVVAHDVGQVHAGEAAQPGVGDRGADERAAGFDLEVQGVLPQRGHGLEGGVGPVGEQAGGDPDEHGQPHDGDRQADGGQLEEAERLVPLLLQDAGDHQVRGRADERDRPAEDGGERQRHQEAGHGQPPAAGPARHLRQEHRHHRRVVEDRRDAGDREAQAHHRGPAPAATEHPAGDAGEEPRASRARGHDVQGCDGQRRLVGEPGEADLGSDDVAQHEHGEAPQQHAGRGEAIGRQQGEHAHEDGQRRQRVSGHRRHRSGRRAGNLPSAPAPPGSGTDVGEPAPRVGASRRLDLAQRVAQAHRVRPDLAGADVDPRPVEDELADG